MAVVMKLFRDLGLFVLVPLFVAGLVGVALVEPEVEVVQLTREVIVTEEVEVPVVVGDGSLETYCSGFADGFILAAGPPPDGWRDKTVADCVETLTKNMGPGGTVDEL